MSFIQTMLPEEFENSMEKSFLFWLQSEIPEITTGGLTIPVQVLSCMPEEYYLKNREEYVLIDVDFASVSTEGYSIGGGVGQDLRDSDPESSVSRSAPWRYVLNMNINVFAGSSAERAKVDGKLRYLMEGIRRGFKECQVYEWVTDTSAVTAFATGTYITFQSNQRETAIHAQDTTNNDFLSNWNVYAKCLYCMDSTTELASSFFIFNSVNTGAPGNLYGFNLYGAQIYPATPS